MSSIFVNWKFILQNLFIGATIGIFTLAFLLSRGFSNNVPSGKVINFPKLPEVTTGARMGSYVFMIDGDTIKPKAPINIKYLLKLDTLSAIGQNFIGRSMSVDNYTYWAGIYFRIIQELRTDTTLKK